MDQGRGVRVGDADPADRTLAETLAVERDRGCNEEPGQVVILPIYLYLCVSNISAATCAGSKVKASASIDDAPHRLDIPQLSDQLVLPWPPEELSSPSPSPR